MSLVIIGHKFEQLYNTVFDAGIFAIADSAITTDMGTKTLLNGFRKVYELEAKVWKPYFDPGGSFRSYIDRYCEHPLIVGFAGSTLVAQHILNSITGHIEKLYIAHDYDTPEGTIRYKILNHCEPNPLFANEYALYEDNIYTDSNFEGLLTGGLLADKIEHAINHALSSASKFKHDMYSFNAMATDMACGLWCPKSKKHEIYVYRMKSKQNPEGLGLIAYTEKELLQNNQVAVLGMRNKFENEANIAYADALKTANDPSWKMLEFLEQCIDQVQHEGSKEIDRPISFRTLERYKITKIQ